MGGCGLGEVESVTVIVPLTGPVILVMCSQSLLTLSQCWLVPRYPSTGHRWAEWGCWGRPVSGPALAEAELLTLTANTLTLGQGCHLGGPRPHPVVTLPLLWWDGGQSQSLDRVTVESSIVECQTSSSNIPLKLLSRYCYLSHCPWFVDCVNSLISWHRHNTMTTVRGRVTCDFRK